MKKGLFPAKTSAFGSLTSLTLLLAMLVCFFLTLPSMWLTTLGKVFAVAWGFMTIVVTLAHAQVLNQSRKEIRLRRSLEKLSREMHAKRRRTKQKTYLES